jgi:F-type H+-transporting ATPase subunit delta
MSTYRISQRYAKSLLVLAEERGKLEPVTDDVRMVNEVIHESRELQLLLLSPIVKLDKKRTVMQSIFHGRVQEETLAFIRILVNKRREMYMAEIMQAFIEQYNDKMGITSATLTTPAPANAGFKAEIIALLKQRFAKSKVELDTAVDASLIGGFVLKFDDKLYDSSVSSQLKDIRKELQSSTYTKN